MTGITAEIREMGKIISIANQKGGVGKTTTAVNLSASLAVAHKQVLLIDLDPQGNACGGFGFDRSGIRRSIYQVLIGEAPLAEVIHPSEITSLKIVPSTSDLAGVEVELAQEATWETRLKESLALIRQRFDYIFLDCPPSLGLLTVNALTASDSVLIPVQCEYYAMEGLSRLLSTIERVRATLNRSLKIEGILLTMFDTRNSLSHQVEEEVRAHFKEEVFKTVIPRNVRLSEAPSHGKPALLYDIKSYGAIKYIELAKELLGNGGK